MALAANLVERQCFTAAQWSQALGQEIQQAKAQGEPDDAECYYACALRVLERLSESQGLVDTRELAERKEAWIGAYENTPHGQPVNLPGVKST